MDKSLVFLLATIIALAYGLYRNYSQPFQSKRGEKVKLYHGPFVSARWKERSDRQTGRVALWYFFLMLILAYCQQGN